MALRRIIPMICLWLMILICFYGCDGTDTTEPVLIDLPPDAEEAIISLGSSPAQTVKIGEKDVDLRVTPGEDELGKTNMLLVQFKGSSDDILSEVTEEVYVSKSGQTDINLQFVRITAPYISVSLAEGEIGIRVDVKGWNFNPNEDIEIYLVAMGTDVQPDTHSASAVGSAWATIRLQAKVEYQSMAPGTARVGEDKPVHILMADADGYFETTFEVPSDLISQVLAGKTSVRAEEVVKPGFTAEVPFAITRPYIYVSPLTAPVDTEIAVTGLNFGEDEDIRIDFGDTEGVTQTRAEANGSFSATFRVPEDAPIKRASVQANGLKSGYTKAVTFNVSIRDIDVDPPVGVVGTELAVKGENFGAEEEIRIDFGDIQIQDFYGENGDEVSLLKTNAEGSFEAKFPVPESVPGTASIQAKELGSGREAEAQFTIFESRIYVDPPAGASGDEVTTIGSGFGANEEIRIDFGEAGEVAHQVTTDADGSFETTFHVPGTEPGKSIIIRVVGQNSGNEAEFPFTISVPSISLDHTEGVMDNEITVNGWGFGKNEGIEIKLFGVELIGEVAETETGDLGEFEARFIVPKGIDPGMIIKVEAAGLTSGYKTRAQFLILPCVITVDPTSGVVGIKVTVTGAGFSSQEDIQIDFGDIKIEAFYDGNGDEVSTLKSDVWGGEFEAFFDIPEGVKPGQIPVTATGLKSGNEAKFPFSVESP